MNEYIIEQKIKTLSDLWLNYNGKITREMVIDNFVFNQWEEQQGTGLCNINAWIVKKEVESTTGINALNQFRSDLDKIIQKIGFVSQCYMDFYKEPFLLYKLTNNKDKIFFYKHVENNSGVKLHFGNNELQAYELLKKYKYLNAFRFLQECRNTIGYIPKLLLLFSALEAMCGKKEIINSSGNIRISYDKRTMKKILSDKLYNKLFGTNGIRHKLDHGEMINSTFDKNYVEEIYSNIICYFNTEIKTNINTNIVFPQRHFYDNQTYAYLLLKPKNEFEINLTNCVKNCDKNFNFKGCDDISISNIKEY